MGDNEVEDQLLDVIVERRRLVWTEEDVIRFKDPMAQQGLFGQQPVVASVYDGRVTDELTDINDYSVGNFANIGSEETNQIIGWSPNLFHDIKPLLFRQTANLFITRQFITDNAMEVFTDTIFQVLTLKNSVPFEYKEEILDEIRQTFIDIDGIERYKTCIQLVLMDPKETHTVFDVKARVTCKLPNNYPQTTPKTLDGYKADLRLFHSNPYITSLVSQAVIEYILDKRDPNCQLVGLYAGPGLPSAPYYQCWPIYKPDSKPQHITREQHSPFRYTGFKKVFIRRVGYLVSKQSLLCVCEHTSRGSPDHTQPIFSVKDDEHYFTTLLKDNTFCICDSRHTYLNTKHEEYEEISFSPYFMSFRPKIIVLPEGLNSIVIHDVNTIIPCKPDYNYIASQLSGQRQSIQEILSIDWCDFQTNFDGKGQCYLPGFSSKGKRRFIHDNCLIYNNQLHANVCFSLIKSRKFGDNYEEQYNVFAEVTVQGLSSNETDFLYFKTIEILWTLDKDKMAKKKISTTKRIYKLDKITESRTNKYQLKDEPGERYLQDQTVWIDLNKNELAYRLAKTPINQLYKLSPISITKKILKDKWQMQFVDPLYQ